MTTTVTTDLLALAGEAYARHLLDPVDTTPRLRELLGAVRLAELVRSDVWDPRNQPV